MAPVRPRGYLDIGQRPLDILWQIRFGQVTPSSKCVGDLALYLVTRGLSTSDVTDSAKEGQIDYPNSVVALLEGRLGFPHKGFPKEVNHLSNVTDDSYFLQGSCP